MPIELTDYFQMGTRARRWSQSDLDGWARHYNTHRISIHLSMEAV